MQVAAIGIALGGDHILPAIGIENPPQIYQQMRSNKLGAVFSTWIIGNTINNALISTGAFEIYYDGVLLSSKLREGNVPSMENIVVRLRQAMESNGRDKMD
eukprot:TRINITY_DN1078_c0_g1_i2.p2 TRINITY_DN1078_c0_g1~~TRINITY_DN1078_c0_g1_i2.p2  ORF type:complete len:101 (-),score=21.88 TRINITY_DN1078_c0_g1_i2:129-431(-)